jgi:transmembrane sensor
MPRTASQIAIFYYRAQAGLLTEAEQREWEIFLAGHPEQAQYLSALDTSDLLHKQFIERSPVNEQARSERMREEIMDKIAQGQTIGSTSIVHRVHFLKTAWVRYAAAIIILFGVGAYLWNTQQKEKPLITESKPAPVKNDISPGSTKATLTLSDGRKVELTPATGTIEESGTNIQNTNGRLEYGKADKVVFNTMSTPRGGQYQLTLPDGTNVWLNAASSITYPTAFTSNTREVTITGEAYFDVRKNPSKPFIVKTPKEKITVLGTQFNVNAYSDEPVMKITLTQGSVMVADKKLKPGQAYVNGSITSTNIAHDLAWKNGFFAFEDADINTIMRQLSRWYDVQVKYAEEIPVGEFSGEIGRNLTLSQVMKVLSKVRINFKIENNTIIILPEKN